MHNSQSGYVAGGQKEEKIKSGAQYYNPNVQVQQGQGQLHDGGTYGYNVAHGTGKTTFHQRMQRKIY